MIRSARKAWSRFWFAPVSAKPLGAFRILYGAFALANLGLLMAVDVDYWLSDAGIFKGNEAAQLAGPLRPSLLFFLPDGISIRVVLAATAIAGVGLTLGWRTRISGILFYLGMLSIHHRNIATTSGADVLVMVLAFYLMLSPCGAAYSLDARRAKKARGWTEADPLIIPWAQRLMQVQIGIVYLVAGLFKVNGAAWMGGTAMHYVLCNREVGRFDLSALAGYPILINLLTYGGLAVELALGFFLWVRPVRRWVILGGISLHIGILFLVNIPIFGEMMVASYLLFLASDEWETLASRCRSALASVDRLVRPRFALPTARPSARPFVATREVARGDRRPARA